MTTKKPEVPSAKDVLAMLDWDVPSAFVVVRAVRLLECVEEMWRSPEAWVALANQIDEHMCELDHSGPTEALTSASQLFRTLATLMQEGREK